MLLDNERAKLAEYEKEYQLVLSEWKSNLSARKAVSFNLFLLSYYIFTLK